MAVLRTSRTRQKKERPNRGESFLFLSLLGRLAGGQSPQSPRRNVCVCLLLVYALDRERASLFVLVDSTKSSGDFLTLHQKTPCPLSKPPSHWRVLKRRIQHWPRFVETSFAEEKKCLSKSRLCHISSFEKRSSWAPSPYPRTAFLIPDWRLWNFHARPFPNPPPLSFFPFCVKGAYQSFQMVSRVQ